MCLYCNFKNILVLKKIIFLKFLKFFLSKLIVLPWIRNQIGRNIGSGSKLNVFESTTLLKTLLRSFALCLSSILKVRNQGLSPPYSTTFTDCSRKFPRSILYEPGSGQCWLCFLAKIFREKCHVHDCYILWNVSH